ncbi:fibronectin type III domain-containing protein [bacterium]|nr:fibronectin type III domain-containing protein [bacterium]
MKKYPLYSLVTALVVFIGCAPALVTRATRDYSGMGKTLGKAYRGVDHFLQRCIVDGDPVSIPVTADIDSIFLDTHINHLDIYLNEVFSYIPFRKENISSMYAALRDNLGSRFRDYSLQIHTDNRPVEDLVPNYYRPDSQDYDRSRMPENVVGSVPLVRNISRPWQPSGGLYTRNIALWPSHGWYYERKLDRWEWQRARLFQTVEDLMPFAFTVEYLVPMLEGAGAQVFLPRERDVQINEVIVDNDIAGNSLSYQEYALPETASWRPSQSPGFAIGHPPYASGINPFRLGTFRVIDADTAITAGIRWIPDIPERGDYGVYISYSSSDTNISDALYTVYHTGGKTEFLVNQQIGGGTWVFLGKFTFNSGMDGAHGRVELTNKSADPGKQVTADAVRFGGGMGNISRNGQVSGRPRFTEGARYYLQYAGMPDTLVYNLNSDTIDYNDDYQCRGEWVNYLKGSPFGPNRDRSVKGLGIPVDLSLAFHTDAGITRNDTTVGTLLIYSTEGADTADTFPDDMSRLANRDFADILQTQIVDDIRIMYDGAWNRRWLWDRGYSEAFRPNVPAALLELLSHQNFLDMKFGRDPRFRFSVSRSIYKAMLRFLATQYQFDYVIQPLPVTHFQTEFTGNGTVSLQWRPSVDSLEAKAAAEKYIVYTRREDNGFDNGLLVDQPHLTLHNLEPGVIYSYKVTAVNDGGESFPSEILSVCSDGRGGNPVLIINGFDRISAPAVIETEEYLGFADFWDQGVPDRYDLDYVGMQYDFSESSPWLDDDAPGHGASYGDLETTIIPGNSFDFPYLHGKSIREAGYSFVSTSDESVMDGQVDMTEYTYVDLILGEERKTDWPKSSGDREYETFPENLQREISRYCRTGGNLFASGSYVGTDLFEDSSDSLDAVFAQDILHFRFRTNHAVKTGGIVSVDPVFMPFRQCFEFNTGLHPVLYAAESPDAIEPAKSPAKTILRYSENNTSAAVAFKGDSDIIIFGFPFETIISEADRNAVMKAVFNYFN